MYVRIISVFVCVRCRYTVRPEISSVLQLFDTDEAIPHYSPPCQPGSEEIRREQHLSSVSITVIYAHNNLRTERNLSTALGDNFPFFVMLSTFFHRVFVFTKVSQLCTNFKITPTQLMVAVISKTDVTWCFLGQFQRFFFVRLQIVGGLFFHTHCDSCFDTLITAALIKVYSAQFQC